MAEQAEALGDAAGYLVAAAEDGLHAGRTAQQDAGALAAPPLAPFAVQDVIRREPRAGARERLAEAARPLARGQETLRAGNVPDPGPAAGQQVTGRDQAAAVVVGQDRGLVAVEGLRHRVDHGDSQRPADARPRLDPPAGHDQAVHPAAQQHLQVLPLPGRVIAGIAHEDRDLARAQRVLGAEHDRDVEPAEAVGGDHAHGVSPSREQAPGQDVRREVKLARGRRHPVPGLGAQFPLAVEGLGGSADRDAGLRRDVPDGGPFRISFPARQTVAPISRLSHHLHIVIKQILYRLDAHIYRL